MFQYCEPLKMWPPDVKNWLIRKDPDAGKNWWQEEKGKTEDELVGWHHWLNGHELEQAPRVSDVLGSLDAAVSMELDMTEWLNWTVVKKKKKIQKKAKESP